MQFKLKVIFAILSFYKYNCYDYQICVEHLTNFMGEKTDDPLKQIVKTNIYVSLQLLVQNRRRKWHFPLNFQNGII